LEQNDCAEFYNKMITGGLFLEMVFKAISVEVYNRIKSVGV